MASNLIRDAKYVTSCLKQVERQLVTTKDCKIQIPVRYSNKKLATVGADTRICGIYVLILEDSKYAVSIIPAIHRIKPTKTNIITINDVDYYEFSFDAGQAIMDDIGLVQNSELIFPIMDEFLISGNIPWFMSYEDIGKLFEGALKYAKADANKNPQIMELMAAIVARDPNDRLKHYRTIIKDKKDLINKPPTYVGMNSIIYSATNTFTKLSGAYFDEGVVSALNTPTNSVERIESLLRK